MKTYVCLIITLLLFTGCGTLQSKTAIESELGITPAIDVSRLEKLGYELAAAETDSNLVWYDARNLLIEGKGWDDTETFYERLPARVKDKVSKAVWNLKSHTAGIAVRFVTNSEEIGAIWDGGGAMNHMAATGNSGLDLYARTTNGWRYRGTGRPQKTRTVATLKKNLGQEPTEYILYLPLYQKVTELKIGIKDGAFIAKPQKNNRDGKKPIIFYGTSITQGGCASRAGM